MADVNDKGTAYLEMEAKWGLLRALRGGTQSMRDAGETYLPKETKESTSAYEVRLNRTFLFNAYDDTVTKLAGKPFAKPLSVNGQLPEALQPLVDAVDRSSTSLGDFARDVMNTAIDRGLCHVLVDYPRVQAQTLEDQRKLGLRPIFVKIHPDDLIGWQTEENTLGDVKLTQVRITETRIESDGDFGDKKVSYVRVLEPGKWRLYAFNVEEKKYVLTDEGKFTYPNGIPLVTVYFNKTGFMVADPPLEDLAWKNLEHYQSGSDQRNVLRFSRFALLFASGISEEEQEKGFEIGPNRLISSTNADATLDYVEHTGAAIAAGERDLSMLREEMETLGLQPLLKRSGNPTATGQAISESRAHAEIQAWIRAMETGLRRMFEVAGKWLNVELSDDVSFDVYSDFLLSAREATDVKQLLEARKNKDITRRQLLYELKRRGLLADTLDVDAEIEALEAEEANLGYTPEEDDDADADDE